jgi:rod shape-determining protein MreB and related proteins
MPEDGERRLMEIRGILLAGGGGLFSNLDLALRLATSLPISITYEPLSWVALGAGRALKEMKTLKKVLICGESG